MVSTRQFVSELAGLWILGAAVLPGCTMALEDSDSADVEVVAETESELLITYTLKAKHSGLCLDVEGGSTANGAYTQQSWCNGADNQGFALVHLGGGYNQLVANHSGLCLDVYWASKNAGARIQQWQCNNLDHQKFHLIFHGASTYSLVAKHSGQCVEVANASMANGAQVIQSPCHWGANQRFYLY